MVSFFFRFLFYFHYVSLSYMDFTSMHHYKSISRTALIASILLKPNFELIIVDNFNPNFLCLKNRTTSWSEAGIRGINAATGVFEGPPGKRDPLSKKCFSSPAVNRKGPVICSGRLSGLVGYPVFSLSLGGTSDDIQLRHNPVYYVYDLWQEICAI